MTDLHRLAQAYVEARETRMGVQGGGEGMTLIESIRELYAKGHAGCCLHIVLDDGCTDDDCVRSCMMTAADRKHDLCLEIASALLLMDEEARDDLYTLGDY